LSFEFNECYMVLTMLFKLAQNYDTRTFWSYIYFIFVFSAVVQKIVSELVRPMRDLNLDHQEYVALKAVMFFNPYNICKLFWDF
jgi:hypothetical protein